MNIKIIDLVKDKLVHFDYLRAGIAYYKVTHENKTYRFPVEIEDVQNGTLYATDKAIMFMRYIRKAMENNELTIVNDVVDLDQLNTR